MPNEKWEFADDKPHRLALGVAGGTDGENDDVADSFNKHIPIYKANRVNWIFGCMHLGSLTLLRNIAPQIGFQLETTWFGSTSFTQVLLRKVGEAPDLGGG